MTSIHPTLPTQTLIPGIVDPSKPYAGTIQQPHGPIVRRLAQQNYSQPQKPMSLGDGRHKELMGALGKLQVSQKATQKVDEDKNKTTLAMEETREWRG